VSGAIPPLKALFDLFVECVGVYDVKFYSHTVRGGTLTVSCPRILVMGERSTSALKMSLKICSKSFKGVLFKHHRQQSPLVWRDFAGESHCVPVDELCQLIDFTE
jgi:hypothetical protein